MQSAIPNNSRLTSYKSDMLINRSTQLARWSCIITYTVMLFAANRSSAAIAGPYSPDANTLHLWHMDATSVPVPDTASSGGTNLTSLSGGATLNNASFSGFGAALSAYGAGPSTGNAAVISPTAMPNDNTVTAYFDPTTGAFTYEAVVRIDFNPAASYSSRGTPFTMISADGNANGARLFTFRIDPIGFVLNGSALTQPTLEFINLNKASSVQSISMPLPTSGSDAIASGSWYHVAVTYNGQANTPNNLSFYWTLMDSTRTSATLLGTAQMTLNLAAGATPNFAIGNTGRNPSGNTSNPLKENFAGLIDEVRICKTALAANQMMFADPAITINTDLTNQVTVLGQTVSFSISASGLPPLRYQWQHAGTNISGATQATYTILAVSSNNIGNYDVIITNNYNSITSSVASLTLRTPINLTWVGYGYSWDIQTSPAWNDTNSINTVYTEGDNVTFDAQGFPYYSTVTLSSVVNPSSVTVNADTNSSSYTDYTLTSSSGGGIFGASGLTELGGGNLFLDINNGYTGPTVISNGTLYVGVGATRGSLGAGVVTNNGSLTFDRSDSITVNNNIAGSGSLTNIGAGTVTIGGTNTFSGSVTAGTATSGGSLTFAGSKSLGQATSFSVIAYGGGAGITGTRLALANGVSTVTNATLRLLNAYASPDQRCNLYTDTGTNSWNGPVVLDKNDPLASNPDGIVAFAANAANSELDINGPISGTNFQGKLTLRGTGGTGFLNNTVTLQNGQVNKTDSSIWTIKSSGNSWISSDVAGGTLKMGIANALPNNATINMLGGTLDLGGYSQQIFQLNGTNSTSIIGSSSTTSDCILTINGSGASTNWGIIQNAVAGGTRKVGLTLAGGSLTLTNVNTYSGDTTITAGTLYLTGAGSINNSSNIVLNAGTTLDFSGLSSGGLTTTANQTLKGNGGFYTVGNLTNAGTIELKASKSGSTLTCDSLQGLSQITYGGTLKVDVSGGSYVGNEVFKLFYATSYSGNFANVIAASPAPGLIWYTGSLAVDGTLRVIPVPLLNATAVSAGSNIAFSGTHGPASMNYVVLQARNLTTPLSSWAPVATNAFDSNGNFTFTVPISTNPALSRAFYTIKIQ